jgi:hypothetical protein
MPGSTTDPEFDPESSNTEPLDSDSGTTRDESTVLPNSEDTAGRGTTGVEELDPQQYQDDLDSVVARADNLESDLNRKFNQLQRQINENRRLSTKLNSTTNGPPTSSFKNFVGGSTLVSLSLLVLFVVLGIQGAITASTAATIIGVLSVIAVGFGIAWYGL